MRWSRLFIPTLRENPAAAESPAVALLQRAGYIRRPVLGTYNHLFLSGRSLRNLAALIRAQLGALGAQEMYLPAGIASIERGELRSHKLLPQLWCQFQNTVHHAWWFDRTPLSLDDVYLGVLQECGLDAIATATAFAVYSDSGPDRLAACPACGYAEQLELAAAREQPPLLPDPDADLEPEEFPTPGRKTIAEIAEFTGLPETSQMKSLVMIAGETPVLALLRGDHQLSEAKLAAALGTAGQLRPALPAEIRQWFGASAGSLGPVGVRNLRILADTALQGRRNMIAGANRDDYHLRSVTPAKDFTPEFHDLRQVAAGDLCSHCSTAIELRPATLLGSIQKPAAEGSEPMAGSYSLSLERILMAVVERHHDKDGIVLPPAIAPFAVIITPVNFADAPQREAAESIYRSCREKGIEALLDDRDERPGVKFKDADLIGIPSRIVIGKKLPQGLVEIVDRKSRQSREVALEKLLVDLDAIAARQPVGFVGHPDHRH